MLHSTQKSITREAFGKVNLGLDVVGRRDDGYHLVSMVMQTVSLCDVVMVQTMYGEQPLSIRVLCDALGIPLDENNLAYKAARIVSDEYHLTGDVQISIEKHIPAAAGMAGGSADAAAVLEAMNELYELNMDIEEKDSLALKLGADVPFCLRRGTWLAQGIGERLVALKDFPPCYMIIVKPSVSVSTPWAYAELDKYLTMYPRTAHPDIDALLTAIEGGKLSTIAGYMSNILEIPVAQHYPDVMKIKRILIDNGALASMMSGSGPTVFGIFADEENADRAFSALERGSYGKFKIKL